MEEDKNEKYGITGPVTMKESSQESIKMSEKVKEYLEQSGFFESEEDAQARERVLGKLDFMVKRFVDRMAKDNKKYGGKIFTFGSYRLGVHNKGADIDALCIVPRHVTRKDFFTHFYEDLMKEHEITELSKVEDAYVPLISLEFQEIPIDLVFARLPIPVIKESINLLNDSILKTMDEKCILSLNGSRVTDAMLRLVPNTAVFHDALRAVKFWAKRRYVYGNSYGYFGGVAYSISVARICQMYPNYCSYDIICKFFEIYSSWKWPNPVLLRPVIDLNYNLKVWDPKTHPADKYNKMPVITPAYPSICSTHNVTQSTCNLMISELHRANDILKTNQDFVKIFDFTDTFKKYKFFIEIKIETSTKQDFLVWSGYVESKVRILASKLENIESITAAIPFPKAFKVLSEESKDKSRNSSDVNYDENNDKSKLCNTVNEENNLKNELCLNNESKDKKGLFTDNKDKICNNYNNSESKDKMCDNNENGESKDDSKICDNNESKICNNNESKSCKTEKNEKIFSAVVKNETSGVADELKPSELNADSPENKESVVNAKRHADNINEAKKACITNNSAVAFENANKICNETEPGSKSQTNICCFFIALEVFINKTSEKKMYIDTPIKEFLDFLNAWEHKTAEMKIEVNSRKKKEVQNFLRDFYNEN